MRSKEQGSKTTVWIKTTKTEGTKFLRPSTFDLWAENVNRNQFPIKSWKYALFFFEKSEIRKRERDKWVKFFAFFISIRVIILIRYENTKVKEKCDEPFPSQLEDLEIYLTHATFRQKEKRGHHLCDQGKRHLESHRLNPWKR